jgi:hypothetical protein
MRLAKAGIKLLSPVAPSVKDVAVPQDFKIAWAGVKTGD